MSSSDESSPFTTSTAGQAFLVNPTEKEKGPGVLVLHSWWGLTDWTKTYCRNLADEGYTVLAPDLLEGAQPQTEEEGESTLAALDPDELSGLVMSSAQTLRAVSEDSNKPLAVIGFSMGASLALWLSARLTHDVAAAVIFYGAQSIDFDDATASYQGHFGTDDHMVTEDERVLTESFIGLGGCSTDFYTYEGAKHWFCESGPNYNEEASTLSWQRTLTFLDSSLRQQEADT